MEKEKTKGVQYYKIDTKEQRIKEFITAVKALNNLVEMGNTYCEQYLQNHENCAQCVSKTGCRKVADCYDLVTKTLDFDLRTGRRTSTGMDVMMMCYNILKPSEESEEKEKIKKILNNITNPNTTK